MEHRTIEIYICEFCGKEFNDREGCYEHERTHIETFTDFSDAELTARLEAIADNAHHYRIGKTVLGMPIETFENLLKETIRRIECRG